MPPYRSKITAPRSTDAELVDVSNEYEVEPIPQDEGLIDVSQEYRDEGGTWESLKKGVAKGMLGISEMGGTAAQYIGGRIGSETLQKMGQESREHVQAFSERYDPSEKIQGDVVEKPELLKSPEWWAYNLGQTGTSILPGIAVGVASGGIVGPHLKIAGEAFKWSPKLVNALARIGTALPAGIVGGAQEGASTYDEMIKKGADEETAARGAEMMTLASAALNAISFDQMLKTGTGAKGKALLNFLKRGVVGGTVESGTEWFEEPAEVAIKRTLIPDKFSEEEGRQQMRSGVNVVPPSFVIGLLTRGIAGNVRKEGSKPYSDAVQQVTQDGTLEKSTDDELKNLKDNTDLLKKKRSFDKPLQEAAAKVEAEVEKRKSMPALPQDFFDQMGTFLEAGQDKAGTPFSIEHVKSFRDQYAANPSANAESVKKLDAFIEGHELGEIVRPSEDESTQLMHSLRSDAMQGLSMEEIMARGNDLKGRHPKLTDDINKLIIEFQGKKIESPIVAPMPEAVQGPAQPTDEQIRQADQERLNAEWAARTEDNKKSVSIRNSWKKRLLDWFKTAKAGDRITSDIEGEVYAVEEKEVNRKGEKVKIRRLVGPDGKGIIVEQDGVMVRGPQAGMAVTAEGLMPQEHDADNTAASIGKGLEEGTHKTSPAPSPLPAEIAPPAPAGEAVAPKTKGFDPDNDRQRNFLVQEILKSESPEVQSLINQAEETWPGEDPGPVVESQIDYDLQKTPEKWLNTAIGKEILARKGWGEKAKETPPASSTIPEPERAPAKAEVPKEVQSLILHDMRTALEEGFKYGMREEDQYYAGEGTNSVDAGTSNPPWLNQIMREMKKKYDKTVNKQQISAVIRKEIEGKGHTLTPMQLKMWFLIEDHLRSESQSPHYVRAAEVMSGAVDTLVADYNEGAAIGQYQDTDLSFPPTEKEIEIAAVNVVTKEVRNGNEEALQTYQAERGEAHREENEAPAAKAKPAEEVTTEKTKSGTQAIIPGASEAETFMLTGAPGEIGAPAPKGAKQETATIEEVARGEEGREKQVKEPFTGYFNLVDIENNLGVFSNRAIPDSVKKDATKLIEAIKEKDTDTISKIAVKYQGELSKGDVQGGPKEVKVGDVVKKEIAHIALREGHRIDYAISEEKWAARVRAEHPESAEPAAKAAEKTAKQKKEKGPNRADVAKEFYQPGNIIWNGYWKKYDKVLSVNGEIGKEGWSVKVQEVDKDGKPLGDVREHSTLPDKTDRIEKKGEAPPIPEAPKSATEDAGKKESATFREFVEDKGIEWPLKVSDPRYVEMLAAYEATKKSEPKAAPSKDNQAAKKQAETLRKNAEGLQKQIDQKRHPAISDQRMTRRRSNIAAGMGAEADRMEQVQKTLLRIADASEAGELPSSLSSITNRAQIESLEQELHKVKGSAPAVTPEMIDKKAMLRGHIHETHLRDLLKATEGKKGSVSPRGEVSRIMGNNGYFYGMDAVNSIETLLKMAPNEGRWIRDSIGDFRRIYNLGAKDNDSFKALLKDYSDFREGKRQKTAQDIIRERERELIGTKMPGYFPTPKSVVETMLEKADIEEGETVLEPSAGKGNIADLIEEQGRGDLSVIEIASTLRDILEAKKHSLVDSNFLEHGGNYDKIVMNPPFENGQDIDHLMHAYNLLNPGGRVVSIMSAGPFFRSDKKATAFRDWLEEVNGAEEKLPEKAFYSSERPTGVATHLVVIDKPQTRETPQGVEMYEVLEQTEKPAFKKWFADSKVVDTDGKPLVVYHGSSEKFDAFDWMMVGTNAGSWFGEGFYFTTDKKLATKYARSQGRKGHVFETYLSIKSPFEVVGKNESEVREALLGRLADITGEEIEAWKWSEPSAITEALQSAGYDGVIVHIGNTTDYVAFEPTQVKSIYNRGTFSPENPDIRYEVSEREDAAYLDAVNRGDMETAQKMVDEAARRAGYVVGPVYHGTPDPNFNRFSVTGGLTGKLGFWFASKKSTAQKFAWQRYAGVDPGIKNAFLEVRNPMRYVGWKGMVDAVTNLRKGDSVEAGSKRLRRKLISDGHDGIVMVGSDTDNAGMRDDYVAFYPNQIKSADPVTRDNKGKVIPLSERFHREKGDIRFDVRDLHRRGLLKPAKIEDVKKFFPGQEVGLDANKNIYVKTRGGKYVTLYKVDSITPDSAVLQVGYGTQRLAPGAVIPGAMGVTSKGEYYIKLHKVFGDTWTLAHESLGHFLEVSGILNTLDVAALRAHIKRLSREGKWETANKKDIGGPEDRANFIADRLAVKEQRGPIGRIILRIRAFIDGILETFGIRNPESILRGIESGRVMERTGREGRGGEQFAPGKKNPDLQSARQAAEKIGFSDNMRESGWMFPDGRMLNMKDFSSHEEAADELLSIAPSNPYASQTAAIEDMHPMATERLLSANVTRFYLTPKNTLFIQALRPLTDSQVKAFGKAAEGIGEGVKIVYESEQHSDFTESAVPLKKQDKVVSFLKEANQEFFGTGKRAVGDRYFSILTPDLPDFMKDYLEKKDEEIRTEYGPFKYDSKSTTNEGWWQLHPSNEFKDFKRADSWYGVPQVDGIHYVVGTREGLREPQAIRFKKDKFTEAQAKEWWGRNQKQFSTKNLFRPKAMEMPAFEAGKLNDWLKNETELNIQAMLKKEKELAGKAVDRLKPSSLPHNTWLENMLKSFEWMDHPVMSRIVKLMMSTRSELYHENFHHMTDNKVIEATRELRRKGLSPTDRAMGKVSSEYELFGKMVDYLDLYWKRDKKQAREQQMKAQEKWMRDHKATDDIVKVWKLHRETYDSGLDLMSAQMRNMLQEVKQREAEEAPLFQGAKESPTAKLRQTLQFHLAQMDEWKGSYAPRVRTRGSWWVWAHKGEGEKKEYVMDFRGSSFAADRLAAKLKDQGWTVSRVEEAKKLPEDIHQQIKTIAVAETIKKALNDMKQNMKGGAHNDLILKFNEELLENISDEIKARGFRSSMIHRSTDKVVKGYKEDPLERLVTYTNNTSAGLAKATTAKMAVNELFGEKDEEGNHIGGIHPVKESRVFSTAQLYIEEQLRNADQTDRWIGVAKSIATFKYLGFNIRSAFVNTTALATTAPPAIQQYALDGKVGFHKVLNALAVASKDYAKIMAGGKLSNPNEQAYMDEIKKKGYDDAQYSREAMGSIAKLHSRAWDLMMDASMKIFGTTEQWNRGTTMLAAYRLAVKQGMSHDVAMERGKTASDKAHGVYGKATMPAWAMGKNPFAKMGQLMYVYAKFSHNYLQMLYDLGFKKHNLKAFTFATLAPLVVGGMAAFPFKDQIFGIFGFILKALFGEDRDPEKWVWDEIRRNYGSTAEAVVRHGVTGAMGLDISSSLSIGVGVPKGLSDLAGPAGGVAEDVAEAWRYGKQGQPWRAFEKIAPRAIENPLKALRESQEGAVTRHGYRVWDEKGKPFMPSEGEATARAFGFRSTRQAVISERTNEAKREIKSYTDRKAAIYERYRSYLAGKKDPAEHKDIIREVRELKAKLIAAGIPPELVPPPNIESMRRQAERMRKPTKQQRGMLD